MSKFNEIVMTAGELECFMGKFQLNSEMLAALLGVTHECVDHWLAERRKIPVIAAKVMTFLDHWPAMITEF